ncbi:hypothetical protein RJ639_023888 [Escallonia herrerae]|uniref:TF-B3 domain-containing protein n=1 Tax=Escallonia herrerae TaxID=1293975 RepID=A0AA88V1T8_9ASTE|nr:hypothetical protein RJ639_023888 [Escallonia herrerae]
MHFKEELSSRILLKGPSGNKWPVELTREEDDVFFQNGWGGFVVDHGLEETDFLVFRYNGSSSFSVLIFDASGCEREASHFVKNRKEQCSYDDRVTEEREKDDSVEVICLDEDAKDSRQEEKHKEQRGGKRTNFSMKRNKNLESSMAQNKIYGPKCHKGKPRTNGMAVCNINMNGVTKGREVQTKKLVDSRHGFTIKGKYMENGSMYVLNEAKRHPVQEMIKKELKHKTRSGGKHVKFHLAKPDNNKKKKENC